MLCHVTLPNSLVLEVKVDPKGEGQECIDQVCQKLGIVEQDYFGLQYSAKTETLWLNLRNRMNRQLFGTQPFRLELKVKFFVPPHNIQQTVTRDLFYHQVKQELNSKKLVGNDSDQVKLFVALIAQAEHGPVKRSTLQLNLYKTLLGDLLEPTEQLMQEIAKEHLKVSGLSPDSAKYKLLQLVSNLQNYGMEYHKARNLAGDVVSVGISPEGVFEYNSSMEQISKIDYISIVKAAQSEKSITLNSLSSTGDRVDVEFRLLSLRAAHAMYRSITEMHSFFRCDTVHKAVSNQFSRDLKGTFVAIFNENTTTGKEYVFDIKRTSREALDHARREIFRQENLCREPWTFDEDNDIDDERNGNCLMGSTEDKQHEELKEQLRGYEEAMLCSVCRDAEISTVFIPCGHPTCCSNCAKLVNSCPLCRESIKHVHRIYLPSPALKPGS